MSYQETRLKVRRPPFEDNSSYHNTPVMQTAPSNRGYSQYSSSASHNGYNGPPSNGAVLARRTPERTDSGEFTSMRRKFEDEMRNVEREMARLRSEFESKTTVSNGSGPPLANGAAPYPIESQRREPEALRRGEYSERAVANRYEDHRQRTGLSSSNGMSGGALATTNDGKTLRLKFDVSQYHPEEVSVKIVDNRLVVTAVHEEKSAGKRVHREFNQDFVLPPGTDPEAVSSSLSAEGILTVESPLPKGGLPAITRR